MCRFVLSARQIESVAVECRAASVKIPASFILILLLADPLPAQPDLSGTWSDPPPKAEDAFCNVGCPVAVRNYLTSLLEDPANDARPFRELRGQAMRFQFEELVPRHLTPAALQNYPFNTANDTSLTECVPWGFARQVLAPHALQFTQYADRVTLYYSEWTAERTVWLDGRSMPAGAEPSPLGFSTGYYDGDTFVVETRGISADHSHAGFIYTDELTAVERFWRTEGGQRLELEVTLSDPTTLAIPIVLTRAWGWAPGEEIFPYDSCEPRRE